jgi:hypothetical protein
MPTSFNYDGKPGYIYNVADDTWYELSGKTDTSGTFEWAGPHTHLSTVTIQDHLVAKKGINNYLNPAARDASITSPTQGAVCFLRQDGSGNNINELQYYTGSAWSALIPDQTGKDSYFLKTNGTITSWDLIPDSYTTSFLLMGGG